MTRPDFLFGNPETSKAAGTFALTTETAPQYLTFQLHEGVYALGIDLIREIRAVTAVSPLPGSPVYVRGIMNLRGAIVPVIDLRIRLGLPQALETSRFAVTIITKIDNKSIGLVADAVHEVVRISQTDVQKSFSLLEQGDQRFIHSLALIPPSNKSIDSTETLVVILNLDRLYDPALEAYTNGGASVQDPNPIPETSSGPAQTMGPNFALSSERTNPHDLEAA